MFGTRLPRYRTRTGMFDDMVAAQVRRLGQAWPELIRPLQFAVEDVPPSDPTPWQTEPNMTSQCFPASHGIPARVVLYRMPLQTEAPTKLELQLAVRDELVARIAELYGRRPEEIDPAAISAPKHHQTDASASALYLTMEESFRAQTWTVAGISVEASMADNPAMSLSCNES